MATYEEVELGDTVEVRVSVDNGAITQTRTGQVDEKRGGILYAAASNGDLIDLNGMFPELEVITITKKNRTFPTKFNSIIVVQDPRIPPEAEWTVFVGPSVDKTWYDSEGNGFNESVLRDYPFKAVTGLIAPIIPTTVIVTDESGRAVQLSKVMVSQVLEALGLPVNKEGM